jgi:hypothetical protein
MKYHRKAHLKAVYGLSLEEYDAMLKAQDGLCAICGGGEETLRNGRKWHLNVDHDHDTGKIRGLLCAGCNSAIGLLKENTDIMLNAIEYVRRFK